MKKVITTTCLLLAGLLGAVHATAAEKPFEYEYNFDSSTDLPEGWLVEGTSFKVAPATDYGLTAQSGENALAANSSLSTDVIYTPLLPLVGGKECFIEFQVINPNARISSFAYEINVTAGNAQNAAAQTISVGKYASADRKEWTKLTLSFTPDTDGDYCFAINAKCTMGDSHASSYSGEIAFDTFFISGTTKDNDGPIELGEPAMKFDMESSEDFPGIRYLPKGWATTGTKPFMRKKASDLHIEAPAPSGDYVLGNTGAFTANNNLLMTAVYDVKAGVPTAIRFNFYAKNQYVDYGYGFRVYAAPAQVTDDLSSATLIGTVPDDNERAAEWMVSDQYIYTPTEDGTVCFIICPYNESGLAPGGPVAFDDIELWGVAEHADPEPEPIIPEDPKGEPEAFENEYNFDSSTDLPEGWLVNGKIYVNEASYWDFTAHSGDNVLGSTGMAAEDAIYTPLLPLVGGKECTIEFYVYSPEAVADNSAFAYVMDVTAGSAQTPEAQTINVGHRNAEIYKNWTKVLYTFTPETDGDYCFAIKAKNFTAASYAKAIAFDTFFISGTRYGEYKAPNPDDLEPNDEYLSECVELPYFENFDGTNYDGKSYLPKEWASTGTVTFVTAKDNNLPAVAGEYYMVTGHNTGAPRDDRAYTPFFNLSAGTEYTVEYSLFMQGNDWNIDDILYLPVLDFTVGTEQEADFHASLGKFSKATKTWEKQSFKFTPAKSGPYCFAFMLTGPTNSGLVCVDQFSVTAPGLIARTEPSFAVKGIYSSFNDGVTMAFEETPVEIVNTSKYADSYKWTVEGAEPSESTEANPSFIFPNSGEYTVTLATTNARGTRTTSRKLNVEIIEEGASMPIPLYLYCQGQDRLYARGETPAFDTDPEGDFVTGYNPYYFDVAQRYDFSTSRQVIIRQISFAVTDRRFRGMTSYYDDQRIKPLSIVVYGSKEDGSLDEANVLGRVDTTIGQALGSSGLGGSSMDYCDVELPEPIVAGGTFYVALHFDRTMEVYPQDAQLGRSYMGTQAFKHGHGHTTLYCKPFDRPDGSHAVLNQWQTIDNLDFKKAGLGAAWSIWCTAFNPAGVGNVSVEPDDSFSAAFAGDELRVSGATEGAEIAVYNMSGAKVAAAVASDGMTVVALPALGHGVYVVKCADKSAKALK